MKLKKLIIGVIIIIIAFFGANLLLKNYLFPFKHKDAIKEYSEEYNLDPYLVLSVIKAESKFKSDAESHKGAMGLMQITGDTAEWIAEQMGLTDYNQEKLYEEDYNIRMGCWYLNNLREEFGDMDLFVAAYNAGRGKVASWLKNSDYSKDGKKLDYIPYKETKKYVDRVNTYYKIYKAIYE
ncbi:lytic transglycosylase domain-containing protein [Clostridium paraputrificum]|uniref:lytic transglycosylase domain-containing protein n=1 Tax=Clostridium TaxID=1485 RepID=UPI003D33C3EB